MKTESKDRRDAEYHDHLRKKHAEPPYDRDMSTVKPTETADVTESDGIGDENTSSSPSKGPRATLEIERIERVLHKTLESRRLRDAEKDQVVKWLGYAYSPSEVQLMVAEQFGVYLTVPACKAYTTRHKWKQKYADYRLAWIESFLIDVPAAIPEVRLRRLQEQLKSLDKAKALVEGTWNSTMANEERAILEAIRKEFGDRHVVVGDGDDHYEMILPLPLGDWQKLGEPEPIEEESDAVSTPPESA